MKKSILIVEDDTDIRRTLVDVLEDEGYKVLSAENGEEGLRLLKEANPLPGLIFLDVMMPVLSGLDFRKEQLQTATLSSIPTVIFSASSQAQQKAQELNATEVLKKPVDLEELMSLVKKYVD